MDQLTLEIYQTKFPSLHAFLAIVPDDGSVVNHQPEFAHATITNEAKNAITQWVVF